MAKQPKNIKIYDPFLKPLPFITSGPDDGPLVCVRINEQWIAPLIGALWPLRYTDKWQGDEEQRYVATQAADHLMFMLAIAGKCGDFEDMPLRQKPNAPCVLQQSLDGGNTWTDVFDYAACFAQVDRTSPIEKINTWNNINQYYTTINNQYAGDPANIDARLPYGDADDGNRDAALCLALQSFIEMNTKTAAIAAKDTEADAVTALNLIAASGGAATVSLELAAAAGIVTGVVASPLLLVGLGLAAGAAAIGAIIVDANDDSVTPGEDLLTDQERHELWCCMYTALAGATLTESAFQASLAGCTGLSARAENVRANILTPIMSDRSTYLALLTITQQFLDAAFAGDLPDDCSDGCLEYCYTWDFVIDGVLGDWYLIDGQYPGPDDGLVEGRTPEIAIDIFPATNVTTVKVDMFGIGTQDATLYIYGTVDGVEVSLGSRGGIRNGVHTFDIVDGRLMENIRVRSVRDFNHGIKGVEISGNGSNPFGESNC